MWLIKLILKKEIARQFIKFFIVGSFNTILDYLIYLALTRLFSLYFLHANIISVLIAMTFSFVLNKYWTFKNNEKNLKKQYLKFFAVNTVAFLLNNSIVFGLVSFFSLYDLIAKAIAVFVGLFWNFFANRYWTFKKS